MSDQRRAEIRVHVGPEADARVVEAVRRGGGVPATPDQADAVVWLDAKPDRFGGVLSPRVRWVQLPAAGIEPWLSEGIIDADRVWTSARGAYADTVAEHALALLLAGARRLAACARADSWGAPDVRVLRGATVAIVGAGGIGRALIALLAPLRVRVVAVNRSGRPVPGAAVTIDAERTGEVWGEADHVVIAAPATASTRHLVGAGELAAMREDAWLVNVARGSLVDTDALVEALAEGRIGGAALDVTDPEPLPDGHPLWHEPRALITPHSANPEHALRQALADRVADNVARFLAGTQLLGVIDPEAGY